MFVPSQHHSQFSHRNFRTFSSLFSYLISKKMWKSRERSTNDMRTAKYYASYGAAILSIVNTKCRVVVLKGTIVISAVMEWPIHEFTLFHQEMNIFVILFFIKIEYYTKASVRTVKNHLIFRVPFFLPLKKKNPQNLWLSFIFTIQCYVS